MAKRHHPRPHPPSPLTLLALRREELAEAMGVNVKVVRELTRDGRIPHLRLTDRLVVYPVGAVAEWLDAEARKAVRS